jgi:hypothetical protein
MLSLTFNVRAAITDSVFTYNGANGINVDSSTLASPIILVDRVRCLDNRWRDGFLMDCTHSAQAAAGLTRNTIQLNAIRVVGLAGPCDISVSDNSFVGTDGGIAADGNVQMHVSNNRFARPFGTDLNALNGASIFTYDNNYGLIGYS